VIEKLILRYLLVRGFLIAALFIVVALALFYAEDLDEAKRQVA
jgi:hypothetical protein